jgi:hypothetical protein
MAVLKEKMVKIRWKAGKYLYYPGEETEVAPSYARFVLYHGYAELVDPSICTECFEKLVMDSGCRTCVPKVDLKFQLLGRQIPVDHGYYLYSAMSKLIPSIHSNNEIGIHPISGVLAGNRLLNITPVSF